MARDWLAGLFLFSIGFSYMEMVVAEHEVVLLLDTMRTLLAILTVHSITRLYHYNMRFYRGPFVYVYTCLDRVRYGSTRRRVAW